MGLGKSKRNIIDGWRKYMFWETWWRNHLIISCVLRLKNEQIGHWHANSTIAAAVLCYKVSSHPRLFFCYKSVSDQKSFTTSSRMNWNYKCVILHCTFLMACTFSSSSHSTDSTCWDVVVFWYAVLHPNIFLSHSHSLRQLKGAQKHNFI